jgi:hypothetical protein
LELAAGLGVHELVVLELLDAAAQVVRQVLEKVLLLPGDALQHFGHLPVALVRRQARILQRFLEGLERVLLAC